jgi:type I restriction enzyme S subunit
MKKWSQVTLGEAPLQIIDGDRGKEYPKKSDFSSTGDWLFLDTGNVRPEGFSFGSCQFISSVKEAKLRKGRLSRGDIVLTTRGTIGNAGFFHATIPFDRIRINSGMVILRCEPDRLLSTFLFQLIRSALFRDQIRALASGSAQPQLPIRDMRMIKIPIPPLEVQHRVSGVLSAYDDLIEVNQRRIAILEDMVRRLFDEWFVRFRYPGHEAEPLVEAEIGMVPHGWGQTALPNVANLTYGHPFKSANFSQEPVGLPVVRIRDILSSFPSTFTAEEYPLRCKIEDGDILIGMDGSFHMNIWANGPALLNQRVVKIVPKQGVSLYWLFLALVGPIKRLEQTIVGTTVAHLSARDLTNLKLLVPSAEASAKAEQMLDPIAKQIQMLRKQNRVLQASRDLMVPKLISGEIDVSTAEGTFAEAAE